MKYLALLVGFLVWSVANATSQGMSYVTGTTSNSTPVTIATVSGTGYYLDFADKIINANAAGVTGNLIIINGGVTVDNQSPQPGSGWSTMTGWPYECQVASAATTNCLVIIDAQGIGIQYTFKIWNGTSRTSRPQ